MKRGRFPASIVCLLGAMVLLASGCGGEGRRVFSVVLPRTGPVLVDDARTEFIDVSDQLKMSGAQSNSIVMVTFGPDVPTSRRAALVAQLRKAGFRTVKCEVTLDGRPAE